MEIPLARVCAITGAPRSTVYHRRAREDALGSRPGPKTLISDADLTERIRAVITESPFSGEGHRKVRAYLRRKQQLHVGKNRVLRLMRNAGLLAPQRAAKRRRPRVHDGRVITDAPNLRWGTDATMAWTREDGWVWVFVLVDHYTDEAWAHVAKVGNRFAALQPVYDAVVDRFGTLGSDVARGIKLRHDPVNTGPTTSRALSTGSGSRTTPPSWVSPRATGWPSGSSGPSRSSASGPGSAMTSTTCANRSPPSSRPPTTSGSSSAWATAHHERRSTKRQLRLPRDSQRICPTNQGRNTP
jgi:putative transposase